MSNKNKSNGGSSKQASGSTSLYNNREQRITKSEHRERSSSALPTFFRWFKKSNHRKSTNDKQQQYFRSTSSAIETLNYDSYSSSRDSLSPSSSPRLDNKNYKKHINHKYNINHNNNNINCNNNINNDHLSASISCDSVISTSTNGFAFIRPNNYQPNGNTDEPKILIENGPDTDSIQRRMKIYNTISSNSFPSSSSNDNISNKRPEISLRRKYFLYGHSSDTIKSNNNNNNNIYHHNHNSFTAGDNRFELSGNYDNINYLDYSLPNNIEQQHNKINSNTSDESNREEKINSSGRRCGQRQRRTVSDSSKDKKSGAYVHVKGKRKAPDPPTTTKINNNSLIYETQSRDNRQYRTLTPLSTLGRKKRKAPQPPIRFSPQISSLNSPENSSYNSAPTSSLSSPSEEITNSILSEGLLDDKDIKAIIDGTKSKKFLNHQSNMSSSISSIRNSNDSISESMSNPTSPIHNKLSSSLSGSLIDSTSSTSSPISPRPWYKRPISTNRDSVIPFKREVVLRTMEKRKGKQQKEQPILPEVSYTRSSTSSSIFDSGSKFSFFSRNKDNNNDDIRSNKDNQKEKRKSGIGMPNISELDREAAEIISKEKAGLTPLSGGKNDDKYYKPPEHLILQQKMFESNRIEKDANDDKEKNNNCEEINEEESSAKSTKDLISKFESSSSNSKITLNTSFIGRTENFIIDSSKEKPNKNEVNIKLVKEIIKLSPTYNKFNNDKKIMENSSDKFTTNSIINSPINETKNISSQEELTSIGLTKMTWSCPFCTLENPNWRIICEICERLKPYEKITNQLNVEKTSPSSPKFAKKVIQSIDNKDFDKKSSSSDILSNSDWDKKAEKVKKYFQQSNQLPKNPTPPLSPLTKSPSETSVNKKINNNNNNKSSSPNKLPICSSNSPKLARTQYQQSEQNESTKSTSSNNLFELNNKIIEEKELNLNELNDDDNKEPLLNSSDITTTITPVFYAITETNNNNNNDIRKSKIEIDLDEIRNARLAKFSPNKIEKIVNNKTEVNEIATSLKTLINNNNNNNELECEKSTTSPIIIQENDNKNLLINDTKLLELEKQRLRDKIRAMNAKALAEQYPVNTNNLLVDEITIITPSSEQQPIPPQRSDKNRIKKISDNNNIILSSSSSSQPQQTSSKLGAIKKVFTKNSNIKNNSSKSSSILQQTSQNNSIEDNFYAIDDNNIKPKKVSSSAQTPCGIFKKQINIDNDTKIYVNLNKNNNDDNCIYENIPKYENQIFNNNQTKLLLNKSTNDDDDDDDGNSIKKTNNEEYIKLSDIDKEQDEVKEISKKLKSAEGLNDFKATLKNSKNNKNISQTDTLVLNKIMKNLEVAIFNGKHEVAAKLAMDLAKMKVQLQVTKLKKNNNDDDVKNDNKKNIEMKNNVDKTIIIDMFVEDRISQKGPIQITIQPLMTVKELKLKAFNDFHIPINLQRWLINDQLLYDDNRTLLDCGVKDKSAGLYLYIIRPSPPSPIKLLQQNQKQEKNDNIKLPSLEIIKAIPEEDDLSDGNNSTDSHNDNIISIIDDNLNGAIALPIQKLEHQQQQKKESITKNDDIIKKKDDDNDKEINLSWECSICTLINAPLALACSACSRSKPLTFEEKSNISEELRKFLGGSSCINSNFNNNSNRSDNILNMRPIEKRNDLNKKSPNRKSTDIYNIIEEIIKPPEQKIIIPTVIPPVTIIANQMTTTTATKSKIIPKNITTKRLAPNPNITKPNIVAEIKKIPPLQQQKINPSSTAAITSNPSSSSKFTPNFSSPNITKSKYRGVDNFNPYRKDGTEPIPISKNIIITKPQQQQQSSSTSKEHNLMLKTPYTISHYMEILKLDTTDVVRNSDSFDCPICLIKFNIGEGCVLRDCLHTFCRDCLSSTIQYSDDVEVKCPYANNEYSCDSVLQEREIRSLVTLEIYEKHLAKSVRYAEHQIENAFHCKTPNCRGWCIYEDNVNQFKCPVCRITNCLTCRVIHDGLSCKQYQDRLNTDCDSNIEARRTKEMLNEMVDKGEAMNCPTCQVIMMKKWGCDWLKCSMCKTEVCWVTRGPRWGVAGKGDTSGGCKCGVNGVKCHPKCNYCH